MSSSVVWYQLLKKKSITVDVIAIDVFFFSKFQFLKNLSDDVIICYYM